MIEPIMFAGIGFLVASLLVIGFIPLVHARAVRLTVKRLEAATPMSMTEIQADKDQLRAEFAMLTRRFEMTLEEIRAKAAVHLADIGKKADALGRFKLELKDKTETLAALQAQQNELTEELAHAREQLAARTATLEETLRALAATQQEMGRVSGDFHETSLTADSQRVELVAMSAHCEILKGQIESYDKETRDLHERIARDAAAVDSIRQRMSQEQARSEAAQRQIEDLQRQLATQTSETQDRERRLQDLLARIDDHNRALTEHEEASGGLHNEMVVAQQTGADLRAELAAAEARRQSLADTLQSEKAAFEAKLRASQDERARLQREIETMKKETEATFANERAENAVLRERINEVAAEIARVTRELEGEGSPIESILAEEAAGPRSKTNGSTNGRAAGDGKAEATLADRIRALQNRAARAAPSGGG
jgi:chromosome segregation ATPase